MMGHDRDIPVAYASSIPTVMEPPMMTTASMSPSVTMNESVPAETMSILQEQGYSKGLSEALWRNKRAFPLRIWVVDNSGSMAERDGHRLVTNEQQHHHHHHHKHERELKFVNCTRWAEMQQTIDYHAQMAALLQCPTIFRLLNDPGRIHGPQQFGIAQRGVQFLDEDLAIAQSTIMNSGPGGVTPLTRHIQEIRASILAMEPQLRHDGSKVVIILATDGRPSNDQGISDPQSLNEFTRAIRSLEGLPVWIVVRLCTDEDSVVEFWNGIDENLEISLEVLDDFAAEAKEVHQHNPWLNYALPLHRMREMGFYHRLWDFLDERLLTKDELRDFCRLVCGNAAMNEIPDPEADWSGFVTGLSKIVGRETKQWNPHTKRMEPWIDIGHLRKAYASNTDMFCSIL